MLVSLSFININTSEKMKKLIATILIIGATCGSSFAKPGGWIKDFFLNNNRHSHCHTQVYYDRPTYYYQRPRVVVYEQPVYYQRQCRPQNIPMQPYQNHYYSKPTPIYPNRW